MERVTEQTIQILREKINTLTGAPTSPHNGGKWNIGHHLMTCNGSKRAFGKISSESGTIALMFDNKFYTKRELAHLMRAFIAGLETK